MLKPQIKSVINMKTTSMSGSKEQTSRKGAHQNTLNHFGTGDFLECSHSSKKEIAHAYLLEKKPYLFYNESIWWNGYKTFYHLLIYL